MSLDLRHGCETEPKEVRAVNRGAQLEWRSGWDGAQESTITLLVTLSSVK